MSDRELSDLVSEVNQQIGRAELSPEQRRNANERLESIQSDIAIFERENSFRRFVENYLAREVQRFTGGDRDDQVCTCNYARCDVKLGNMPGAIQQASNVSAGIDEWRRQHIGEPVVLTEAARTYREKRASVKSELRDLLIDLTGGFDDREESDRQTTEADD